MWFKSFMSESIVRFKRPDYYTGNQSRNLNWKKNHREGMKMFWKYQLAVWLSIRNFYSHFTKVTRKCECYGCIVEHWNEWICIQLKLFLCYLCIKMVESQGTVHVYVVFYFMWQYIHFVPVHVYVIFFEWKQFCAGFLYRLFIYVLPLEI
jgi:hypothetical protein